MNDPEEGLTTRQIMYLRRLAEAKARLLASFAGLDAMVLTTQPVTGQWSVKDILTHVVVWNEEFRADIDLILQGRHPGYERRIEGRDDFSGWNERWIAERRNCTWEEALAAVERDYQKAIALILRLQRRDFRRRGVTPWKRAAVDRPALPTTADTESVETLVTYHWRHMHQHAGMIEKWRKRLAVGS